MDTVDSTKSMDPVDPVEAVDPTVAPSVGPVDPAGPVGTAGSVDTNPAPSASDEKAVKTELLAPLETEPVESKSVEPVEPVETEPVVTEPVSTEPSVKQEPTLSTGDDPSNMDIDSKDLSNPNGDLSNPDPSKLDSSKDSSIPSKRGLEESHKDVKKTKTDLLIVPTTTPQLFYTPLKSGLVYDVRMRYHAKIFTSYFEYIDPHPEDPRRIYRIYKKLAESGLIQDSSLSGTENLGPLMQKIPIREATNEEILEVHSEDHLKFIASTETMSRDRLLEETEAGDSIYVNNDSFLSAKLSCGGSIEACKAVIEGKVKNSLAVVRPPGHHAEPHTPGGFCLFSNVAVAAKTLLKLYPESVRKIVILDWDIHHGNGTQKTFYNDPRILYVSLHRYENGKFYPGTKAGGFDMTGEGDGEGYNINIPWRGPGTGDGDYVYAFNKVVLPVLSEFDPDFVIVSSGFDAADGDIVGGCHVTPAGYGYMTHMLKALARGKMSVILEGGYNLDSISKSALAVAKVLIGEPPEATITAQPLLDTIEVVDEVIKHLSKYWTCLKPGNPSNLFEEVYDLPENVAGYKLSNINDPIRTVQANDWFARHGFINLPVVASDQFVPFTTDLPPKLDDLVMASGDIYECGTVVVSVHDPPEVWASVNPLTGSIEGNSSVVLEHPMEQVMQRIESELGSAGPSSGTNGTTGLNFTPNGNSHTNDANSSANGANSNGSGPSTSASTGTGRIGYIDINIPSFTLPTAPNGSLAPDASSSSPYNPAIFAQELLLYVYDNYISYFHASKLVFLGFGDAYQAIVHLFAKRPSPEIKELVKGTVCYVNRSNLKPLVPVMDESMIDWFYQNLVVFTSCLNPCWVGNGSNATKNGPTTDEEIRRPRRKFGRVIRAKADGLWEVIAERFDEGCDFVLDSIEDESTS